MRINIFYNFFVPFNLTNKHKAKTYNQCTYTQIIIKKFHNYMKKLFIPQIYIKKIVLSNIRMINL